MSDAAERILTLLRDAHGFVSGEAICRELGSSRTAVWKQINKLREAGYRIASAPRRGYALEAPPNVPLPVEVTPLLHTRRLGKALHFLPQTESTNQVAAELARGGEPEGAVVVADAQTSGRGRLGRQWFSPPGTNLYVSVLLRPDVNPVRVPQVSLIGALSVVRAVHRLHPGLELGVKWPNDVLLGGRKLAGILCEMAAEIDHVHHLILGVGLNVNVTREQLPAEVADSAVSLRDALGAETSRSRLLAAFLDELEQAYDLWTDAGLAPFLDEWRELSILRGRRVKLAALTEEVEGTAADLSPDGALLLKLPDGSVRPIHSGEAHVLAY